MTDEQVIDHFDSFDGQRLAWREMGSGRPVVLLHGYISDAVTNWVRFGHAAVIARAGFRVIMPDLRAHGASARPHDPHAYPPDALAQDGEALIAHLGLSDYDLGGYSLGARTVMRMLVRGARPRRAVIAGMGLTGITNSDLRAAFFLRVLTAAEPFAQGSPEWAAAAFLKTTGGDPQALVRILDTFVNTPLAALSAIDTPMLVVSGADDDDNGSARDLADAIPTATYCTVPGTHMSAVLKPDLGEAIAMFLAG